MELGKLPIDPFTIHARTRDNRCKCSRSLGSLKYRQPAASTTSHRSGQTDFGADSVLPPELSGDMEMEWTDPPTKTDSGRKKGLRLQQPPQLGACSKERVHSNPLDHHSLNEIETLCTPKTNQTNHAHLPNVRLTFLLLVPPTTASTLQFTTLRISHCMGPCCLVVLVPKLQSFYPSELFLLFFCKIPPQ